MLINKRRKRQNLPALFSMLQEKQVDEKRYVSISNKQ